MPKGRHVFLTGFFMGLADLIPGISGGTVAFLSGIYKEFLLALRSLNLYALKLLVCLRFSEFIQKTKIGFLAKLFSGALISIFLFSKLFHKLMMDPTSRIYMQSLFFGLIVGSLQPFQHKMLPVKVSKLFFLIIGGFLAFFLTTWFQGSDFFHLSSYYLVDGKWIIGGFLAACVMLLPGISGSFILLILGLYIPLLKALSDLSSFENVYPSLQILLNLSLGILLGFIFFSRVLLMLLDHFKNVSFSFLLGLMLGSLYVIWPYHDVLAFSQYLVSLSILLLGIIIPQIPKWIQKFPFWNR